MWFHFASTSLETGDKGIYHVDLAKCARGNFADMGDRHLSSRGPAKIFHLATKIFVLFERMKTLGAWSGEK